jgi:putative membrane protein
MRPLCFYLPVILLLLSSHPYLRRMQNQDRLKTTLLQLISTSVTLLVADYLMDSIRFEQPWVAIITAVVLALLNAFLKPLLVLLTIPATVLTLGLFLLVINAAILMIADQLVDGFRIEGFWSAILLAIFISLVNGMLGGNVKVVKHSGGRDLE